jgi:archaellin
MKRMNKKAVMGVGMLMIFIATVLVSAMAAGVLIAATGLLQQRALTVERSVRERLVSGIEVFSVYSTGNVADETINEFEFLIRSRAGSTPVQLKTLSMSFISQNLSLAAELNESQIGRDGICSFSNLTAETQFCIENRLGNNDTILEEGEILTIRYHLNDSHALSTEEDFEVIFQPKTGALEILQLRTPEIVLTSKIRMR